MNRKALKRIRNIIMGCVLIVFVISACVRGEREDEIRIGYFNNLTHAQALYMKSRGLLEDYVGNEVRVSWSCFNAGPAEIESLFAGQIDIGYIGPVPAITANVQTEGDVVILSGATMAGAELVTGKNTGIENIMDLDGKIVAIPQLGNTQHLCLLKLLSDHGLQTVEKGGTVTVTAVENGDVQSMLEQGNIDAALVPEPWGTTLLAKGAKLVLDYDQIYKEGNYPAAVVVVRKDYLMANPELVELFLQAHEDVTQIIRENPKDASIVINEEMHDATGKNISEDILTEAFRKIRFATDVDQEIFDEFWGICKEEGVINAKYEILLEDLLGEN